MTFAIFFIEIVDVKEQRVCIKFCFKLGKSASKTHTLLEQGYDDDTLGQMQICNLFNRLKSG